jgi:signal transduction histidine kinase
MNCHVFSPLVQFHKKTNINGIVKETLSQVEMPENVELITELSHLPRIKADKDMIKRVFLNLTVNGMQAMKNGGTLKVSTKKTKESVEVSFRDTGIGIPKEDMRKIFIPESHDGSIKVESEEGKGSIAYLTREWR